MTWVFRCFSIVYSSVENLCYRLYSTCIQKFSLCPLIVINRFSPAQNTQDSLNFQAYEWRSQTLLRSQKWPRSVIATQESRERVYRVYISYVSVYRRLLCRSRVGHLPMLFQQGLPEPRHICVRAATVISFGLSCGRPGALCSQRRVHSSSPRAWVPSFWSGVNQLSCVPLNSLSECVWRVRRRRWTVREEDQRPASAMNIFRLLGDLSHLLAIIVLLLKIWKTRSCAGTSQYTYTNNSISISADTFSFLLCLRLETAAIVSARGFLDVSAKGLLWIRLLTFFPFQVYPASPRSSSPSSTWRATWTWWRLTFQPTTQSWRSSSLRLPWLRCSWCTWNSRLHTTTTMIRSGKD